MEKYKHSIRNQFSVIFIVLWLSIILACVVVNSFFFENYYRDEKCRILKDAYDYFDDLYTLPDNEIVDFSEKELKFNQKCDTCGIAAVIVDSSLNVVAASTQTEKLLERRLLSYIFKSDPNYLFRGEGEEYNHLSNEKDRIMDDYIIESSKNYSIRVSSDPAMGTTVIELMGTMNNGNLIMIRTAVESIKMSVGIANRFLIYIGIFAVIVGSVLVFIVTSRITKPIMGIASLSNKMANLDFTASYEGKEKNEIGYLGYHMNELSKKLKSTISELKTANNELESDLKRRLELDEQRADFISNVSHELKTPLAIIQGYAEGLKENVNEDEESRNYYCDVIIDEASKMNFMVRNLLALNQLESGASVMTMEHVNISEMIRNCVISSQILVEQTGARISLDCPDELFVWCDEFKIEEVFNNYFINALHYVSGEKRIIITAKRAGDRVRVNVYNDGERIPEEALEHIWTKFYKADKARSREYGGSGVGLSIVKAIMEAHNMEYGVKNENSGVSFWFELDAKNETKEEQ